MSKTVVANTNLAGVPANTIKGNPTGSLAQPIDLSINTNTLEFVGNVFGVKLATGGGIIADTNGIRLAPAGGPATTIAVRQNDTSSPLGAATDDPSIKRSYPTTGNDTGVLQPYFQTFQGACDYANSNFSSSYTIYIDTDTIEGMPSPNGYAPVVANTSAIRGQFFTDSQIQAAFGSAAASAAELKAGNFIFNGNYNISNSVFSGFAYGAALNVPANGNIVSRYMRTVGSNTFWTTNRKYNEAPRKIISRYYFDTTGALAAPSFNGTSMSGGNLGTNAANWSRWTPNNYPTLRTGYLGTRLGNWGSRFTTQFFNICFEYFTNASDNAVQIPSTGTVGYYNCTMAFLGSGYYNYSALYPYSKVNIYSRGVFLQDPGSSDSSPVLSFPGYSLAIVGNPPGSQFGYTKFYTLFNIAEPNSWVSFWSYDQYIYSTAGGSGLMGSVILDGLLNIGAGGIFQVSNGSTLVTNGVVLSGPTLSLQTKGVDQNLSTNNGYTALSYNASTYNIGQGSVVSVGGGYLPNWTYQYLLGPTPTQVQSNIFYPLYAWYTLPQGGTTLPNATVAVGGLITFNSNITSSGNINMASFAPQTPKTSAALLTNFAGGGTVYGSTGFQNVSTFHTILSPWNNQTYTLKYY